MEPATLSAGMARVNDKIAEAARREGRSSATFVCECGRCGGDFVDLSLAEFDEHRAREESVVAPNH
jgi:hypothetical protein